MFGKRRKDLPAEQITAASMPSNSETIAALLRETDGLVRKGHLTEALDRIRVALDLDPKNFYARAYEVRVTTLLDEQERSPKPQPVAPAIQQDLAKLSQIAVEEAERNAQKPVDQSILQPLVIKQAVEETGKAFDAKTEAIQAKIAEYLQQAGVFAAQGNFSRALDEIARAHLLDPINDEIESLEKRIRADQEQAFQQAEEDRRKLQEEEQRRREEQIRRQREQEAAQRAQRAQTVQPQPPPPPRKDPNAERRVRQSIEKAQELYTQQQYDQALEELAALPAAEAEWLEVMTLKRIILKQQLEVEKKRVEFYRAKEEEHRRNRSSAQEKVNAFLLEAERCLERHEPARALDAVSRAYSIDPDNEEIRRVKDRVMTAVSDFSERAISAAQTREKQRMAYQEEHFRLLMEAQKGSDFDGVIEQHMLKAHDLYIDRRFEEALTELAILLALRPSHVEALALRELILEEQAAAAEQQTKTGSASSSHIDSLLKDVRELMTQNLYLEALDLISLETQGADSDIDPELMQVGKEIWMVLRKLWMKGSLSHLPPTLMKFAPAMYPEVPIAKAFTHGATAAFPEKQPAPAAAAAKAPEVKAPAGTPAAPPAPAPPAPAAPASAAQPAPAEPAPVRDAESMMVQSSLERVWQLQKEGDYQRALKEAARTFKGFKPLQK